MREKTLLQIAVDAERELYQSAGLSVQVYAQDNLVQKIQNAFQMFFDDTSVKWKRFIAYTTYTLDGTSGHTTVPVKNTYKNYEDIIAVYPGTSQRRLAGWPGGNPASFISSTPLFVLPDPTGTDLLKVLPSNASGQIVVEGRLFPTFPFNPSDVVPFDALTLTYFVAWQYAVDDGSNPAGSEKLRQLFEERYKQMKINANSEPIALNSQYGNIPSTWRDEG
jgi:hypothetical protein